MVRELALALNFPNLNARYAADEVVVPLPLGLEENLLPLLLDHMDRFGPAQSERLLMTVGQVLFDQLLPPGPVLALYLRAMTERQQAARATLRIRIIASDPGQLAVPWEFFYNSRHAVFPAAVPETPVIRTLGAVRPGQVFTPTRPLRVLLAAASPKDEPPLNASAELNAIKLAARNAQAEVLALTSTSSTMLRRALEQFKPHIVHFMGHGYVHDGEAGIRLEDRNGLCVMVPGERLAEWLEPASPRLVVLNACEAAQMHEMEVRGRLAATLLQAGIPAVVAMQYRIPDEAGALFGQTFFQALFGGATLERAVQAGRHALMVNNGMQRHFATPVLYMALESGGRLFAEVLGSEAPYVPQKKIHRPFLYLEPFERAQHALFFGRSRAIEALSSRMATHRLLVVHGRSGVGKTSLLQAGLAQSAAANLYLPIPVRFLQEPLQALEAALNLATQSLEPPSSSSVLRPPTTQLRLAERLKLLQERSRRTVLLILDQFEEFFTLVEQEVRQRFLEALHTLYADPGLRLRIVLVIREDFFGALDQLREQFPAILNNTYSLTPLIRDEAREALEGPLHSLGIYFDAVLPERIVEDLWQDGVEPAHLQIVGFHLYEASRARGDRGLTLAAYRELEGAGGILKRYLTSMLRDFPSQDRALLEEILAQFITRQGTRQPASSARIAEELGAPIATVEALLQRLIQAHLVRRLEAPGQGGGGRDGVSSRWELAHDVLIEGIQQEVSTLRRRLRSSLALMSGVWMILLAIALLVFLFGNR